MRARVYLTGWLAVLGLAAGGLAEAAPPVADSVAWSEDFGDAEQGIRTVYVKRSGASVKSGPGRNDPDVAQLSEGDALTVLEEGLRLRVRTAGGQEGYIPSLYVSDSRPRRGLGNVGVLAKDDLSPDERADVNAIRGLSPVAEKQARESGAPEEAIRDVEKMEQLTEGLSAGQIDRFLREGGLGS